MVSKKKSASPVRVIPLGGFEEVGRNNMVIECGDDLILIDGGLGFPKNNMYGIEIVLADMTYIKENQDRFKAIVLTHAHEDHIGGITEILKQITVPVIYGPPLALGLIEKKMLARNIEQQPSLIRVKPRESVKIGTNFTFTFIRATHSIPDCFHLLIDTPVGTVIHTGDFKVDYEPIDKQYFDIFKLAEAGEKGVKLLISDSTNALRPGATPSESAVGPNIEKIFEKAKDRIIITTFASQVHRVQQILQYCVKHKRKVAMLGKSMEDVIQLSKELGYINFPDDLIMPLEDINKLPLNQVCVLTTGSQGEPLAALSKMARDEHKYLKVIPGDTVIFSANPIPGNELAVVTVHNQLTERGAFVYGGRDHGLHVSGHGAQEDLKLMLALTKPEYFMPEHGEYIMLVKHGELAVNLGVNPDNIFIMSNGDVLELSQDGVKVMPSEVPVGNVLIDRSGEGVLDDKGLKERNQIGNEGIVTVVVNLSPEKQLLNDPYISFKGVSFKDHIEEEEAIQSIIKYIKESTERAVNYNKEISIDDINTVVYESVRKSLFTQVTCSPFINHVVQQIDTALTPVN